MLLKNISIYIITWLSASLGRCSASEINKGCRMTKLGSGYTGQVSITGSGRMCIMWQYINDAIYRQLLQTTPSLFPDGSMESARSYCRNPGSIHPEGPWCFLNTQATEWEYCDIPLCECRTTKAGYEYMGRISKTSAGLDCQRWDSQTPHGHTYVDPNTYPEKNISAASNYCRNPAIWWEHGVWCYTLNPSIRWQYCDVDFCDCKTDITGYEYQGKKNTTIDGYECQTWSSQEPHEHSLTDDSLYIDGSISDASNFCRNPDFLRPSGPWCFTTNETVRWQYCDVSLCEFSTSLQTTTPRPTTPMQTTFTGLIPTISTIDEVQGSKRQSCRFTTKGTSYQGNMSVTANGRTCQRWDSQTPHAHPYGQDSSTLFPDSSIIDAANYCRNPSGDSRGPWCYTTNNFVEWEFCAVPMCDCVSTPAGFNYMGRRIRTAMNYTCQRWDAQSPHRHPFTDDDMYPENDISKASNFCRNPDRDVLGNWCFILDNNRRWDYCNIPMCECKVKKPGFNYMGSINYTRNGYRCQRWDSQSPHAHGYYDVSMFPDASLVDAANFCRNPDVQEPNGPWCFTTDPNVQWDYCDVTLCELGFASTTTTTTRTTSSPSIRSSQETTTTPLSTTIKQTSTVSPAEHGDVTNPPASVKSKDCLTTKVGFNYIGTISTTKSGRICQSWQSSVPHFHPEVSDDDVPDEKVKDAKNYCRNPRGQFYSSAETVWCYTTDINVRWEYCTVPVCGEPLAKGNLSTILGVIGGLGSALTIIALMFALFRRGFLLNCPKVDELFDMKRMKDESDARDLPEENANDKKVSFGNPNFGPTDAMFQNNGSQDNTFVKLNLDLDPDQGKWENREGEV